MENTAIKLKKQLIRKRRDVKQKLEQLKRGEILREEAFSPITKRLQTIATKLDNDNINSEIKAENLDIKKKNEDCTEKNSAKPFNRFMERLKQTEFSELPAKQLSYLINDQSDSDIENYVEDEEKTKENIHSLASDSNISTYLKQFDILPRKYINEMIRDTSNQFDFKYGVRYIPSNREYKIGDSIIEFKGADLFIGNSKFIGTPGLYELLFKKNPAGYENDELQTYLNIVNQTNAHKRHYKPNGQIDGNTSFKYKKIISRIVSDPQTPHRRRTKSLRTRTGLGHEMIMEVTDNPIDYVYWDDPNELVDRLRLLVSSQLAGNTGHTNEINSIIEELREANIIL